MRLAPEPQTAFISYSREDSEFARRLAEDLKAAGTSVWLDQLDIAPGQRWAKAVEDALNDCPRMLVILSPSSANSTNVDDEVSFALDEKKTVIPVIYRDCKTPFRLRPFQYVDFRSDYNLGLKQLLQTLPPETPAQSGPTAEETALPDSNQTPAERVHGSVVRRDDAVQGFLPQPEQSAVFAEAEHRLLADRQSADEVSEQNAGPSEADEILARSSQEAKRSGVQRQAAESPHSTEGEQGRVGVEAVSDAGTIRHPPPPRVPFQYSLWMKVVAAVCGILIVAFILYWAVGSRRGVEQQASNNGESPRPAAYPDTWESQNSGVTAGLSSIVFAGPNSGWAVSDANDVLHTEDGRTWNRQTTATNPLKSIVFVTPQSGWAAGEQGLILHTKDGGNTWILQAAGNHTSDLYSIAFATQQLGCAVGGYIVCTEDGGQTWKSGSENFGSNLFSVAFRSARSGLAVGVSGYILRTGDGGRTWQIAKKGTFGDHSYSAIAFVTPESGWVVGSDGAILHTEDGGLTWRNQTSGTKENLESVAFPTPLLGWVVGHKGTILHTEDGGSTWKKQASGTGVDLYSVAFPTAHSGWAVGEQGTILHWEE